MYEMKGIFDGTEFKALPHLPGLLNAQQIRELCEADQPMIAPFHPDKVRVTDGAPILSRGCSSFGYDISMADDGVRIFEPCRWPAFNMKRPDPMFFNDATIEEDEDGVYFILPPHTFALAYSVEQFSVPDYVTGVCLAKSTWVRAGVYPLMSPLEAGWRGKSLTIEIANLTPAYQRIPLLEGCAQVLFFAGEPTAAPYAGKYQDQPAHVVLGTV